MRVAALYDIHGNLPALEAVLDEIRREDVAHIVIGGDVVPGPMPRETLARLSSLDRGYAVGGDHAVALSAFDRCPQRGGDISVARTVENDLEEDVEIQQEPGAGATAPITSKETR